MIRGDNGGEQIQQAVRDQGDRRYQSPQPCHPEAEQTQGVGPIETQAGVGRGHVEARAAAADDVEVTTAR